MIRPATLADLEQMLDLADAKRRQYERYQPRFHRPSRGAKEIHRPYVQSLLDEENTIVLVDEAGGVIEGFIVAQTGSAPPVYDPGGSATTVDDFVVRSPGLWATVGRALLDEVRRRAKEQGAVEIIVICGPRDHPKRDMLTEAGLTVATELLVDEL
jgi:GNAT superfamily N-acetyltransferase